MINVDEADDDIPFAGSAESSEQLPTKNKLMTSVQYTLLLRRNPTSDIKDQIRILVA